MSYAFSPRTLTPDDAAVRRMLSAGQQRAQELKDAIKSWKPVRNATIHSLQTDGIQNLRGSIDTRWYIRVTGVGVPLANVYDRWTTKRTMEGCVATIDADRQQTEKVVSKFKPLRDVCDELQKEWTDLNRDQILVYLMRLDRGTKRFESQLTSEEIEDIRREIKGTTSALQESERDVVATLAGLLTALREAIDWLVDQLKTALDVLFRIWGGQAENAIELLEQLITKLKEEQEEITNFLSL